MKHYNLSYDNFREDLFEAMRKQGIDQPSLARLTGISQSSISLFLTKKRGLSGKAVLRLWSFVYGSLPINTPPTATPSTDQP